MWYRDNLPSYAAARTFRRPRSLAVGWSAKTRLVGPPDGQQRQGKPRIGLPGGDGRHSLTAAPEQVGKPCRVGIEQHGVVIATGRPDIRLGARRQRVPPPRGGRQPFLGRQE